MRTKCLLINPWIYDFAALNLWSRPLGLLRVAEYLSRYDVELGFIDCMEENSRMKKFGTGKYPRRIVEKPEILKNVPKSFARYGMHIDEFRQRLIESLPCDIIFVTSIMTYWYPGVQEIIEIIKTVTRDTPVVLGGIYATLFQQHAIDNSGADYVYHGEFNETIESIAEHLGLRLYRKTNSRPYYRLGLYDSVPFAPIMTSHGCPYRCSYCASSVLFNYFMQQNPADVINEIHELSGMGVKNFAFYDDALLFSFETHLKIILEDVISSKIRGYFHCPNGLHTRFIDAEAASLMKRAGFQTLRLSLETVNEKRQSKTGGKVSTDALLKAVKHLKQQGFTKENIGVYLMYGLPSQPLDEVEEGIDLLKSLNVRIHLTEFSPIPHTSCWDDLKKGQIIDDEIDPLLTNNSVFSILFSGYDNDRLVKIKNNVKQYNTM